MRNNIFKVVELFAISSKAIEASFTCTVTFNTSRNKQSTVHIQNPSAAINQSINHVCVCMISYGTTSVPIVLSLSLSLCVCVCATSNKRHTHHDEIMDYFLHGIERCCPPISDIGTRLA